MKRKLISSTLAVSLMTAAVSIAQSSYSGMETRQIRALSEEQIAAYTNGEGMGLALAAELNGYPGPKHVLDLGDSLDLSEEQRSAIEAVWTTMRDEAVALGRQIVDAEQRLDRELREGSVDVTAIEERLTRIGELNGRLRFAHIRAHFVTAELLTGDQRTKYGRLRGYGAEDSSSTGHAHHGHGH